MNQKFKKIESDLKSLNFKLIMAHKFLKQAIKEGINKEIDFNNYF